MIPAEFLEMAHAYQLLSELDPQYVAKLLPLAKDKLYRRDEIIFPEGAKSQFLYIIIGGSVALETIAAGRPVRIQTLNPGDAMGWSSLTQSGRTHFQARALSQVSTIAFRGEDLRKACDEDPKLGYVFMKRLLDLVTERLDATRMQLVDLHGGRTFNGT